MATDICKKCGALLVQYDPENLCEVCAQLSADEKDDGYDCE
jgi:uncharacterized Zn finger protein (UPF0148 family)